MQEDPIDTIAAGEIVPVTIPLGEEPPTGQSVPITVEVQAVPGEEKTDNNIQEFSVIFTTVAGPGRSLSTLDRGRADHHAGHRRARRSGLALVALIWAIVLTVKLRRLRAAQRTVLGDAEQDLVAHSAALQEAFVQLRDWIEETAGRLEERTVTAEARIDGCVAYTSLVRYDAWGEASGHQSSSVALLDLHRTGVVMSSILHRDQARVYVKAVREGESDLALSPEEQEAIENAMAGVQPELAAARKAAAVGDSPAPPLSDPRCGSPISARRARTARRLCAPPRPPPSRRCLTQRSTTP